MNSASSQTFIIREECEKAAWQHGFRRVLGEADGWAAFGSTTAQGTLWLAANSDQGPWLLALDHPGVIAELALPSAGIAGPGLQRFSFPNLTALYAVLPRLYQLASSLPDAPLNSYQQQTAHLPKTTEAERLVVQRIGQDIFRANLMDYWCGACAVTGIAIPELLRASHAKPWANCETDQERLNVFNGFLLCAHLDALFDQGLMTFDKQGNAIFSPSVDSKTREKLNLTHSVKLRWVAAEHQHFISWHQEHIYSDTKVTN